MKKRQLPHRSRQAVRLGALQHKNVDDAACLGTAKLTDSPNVKSKRCIIGLAITVSR